MSTYELGIDGSGAEAGAQRIVKSFDAIKAAADRMEGGVSAAAKKASSSFADMQRNARPVSDAAIRSLKALSSVFAGFRAPSDAAVRNTIIFLQGLKSVGTLNLGRVTGLASLLATISGYRGPSPTAGKNTLAVLNALRFVSTFSMPRGLVQMLAALSTFKGPSAAAARNVTALLNALNSFKGGSGLTASIRALRALTEAANSARTSLNSLKGAAPKTINIKSNTSQAEKGIGNLIKSNNLLQTALLRTQTAWNALGGILAGKAIIGAANALIEINAQLQAATGSATKAGFAFAFIRELSEKLGLDFRKAAESFGFFLGSVKGTNLTLDESRQIFEGFSTAARALQLSTADVDGVFRALGQMMSKGKIQAEELRGQLGDRLPGAFVRFAVALKMTKPGELDQALKKGAVSGEKMKQAIIDVANALQVEFAGSADKMSKTVDAAFNRLKNAFTFASGDLGHSGLNQALISVMDAATKLLQSNTLNTLLMVLGKAFKFLGDHIEAVATIIGTLALSSTLKWAASLVGLAATSTAATAAVTETAAATAAAGGVAAEAAVATTALGAAWARLNLFMKANLFVLIASAIVGLVLWLGKSSDAMNENAKALDAVNAKMPDAVNWSDTYAARLLNISDSANQVTASLQEMIQKMNESALRASQEDLKGLDTYKRIAEIGGYAIQVRDKSGKFVKGPEGYFTKEDQDLLNRVVYHSPTGGVALRGNIPQTRQEFEQLGAAMSMVDTRATGPGGGNFAPIQSALHARFNALLSMSRQKGYKGLPYSDWAEQILPEYNKPTGGISGGAPAQTKKKHGKSEAEKAQDDINNAIDQAMNGMTDLEGRAKSTSESIDKLLSGSFDKVGAAAHIAAVDQEKSFEDAIKGPENKIKGVLQLAKQLGVEVSGDTEADRYNSAKEAIIGYMEARQKAAAEAKADEKVATDILAQKQDNQIQSDAINLLQQRGKSQAEVNRYIEIETALVGVSADRREEEYAKLKKELEIRDQLKLSMQAVNEQRELENKQSAAAILAPMYQHGARQEDIDYMRELVGYAQELADAGADPAQLNNMVATRAAALNLDRVMKDLSDHYEQARQAAGDMADAIVGGFRDGLQAGDSFLDMFKNIFKQISKIIMDFVLFNPLKQWLQQVLTQTLAPNATAGFGGVGTPAGTVNSYSTGNGLLGALNTIIGGISGRQQGYFQDVNPRNAPVSGGRGYFDSNGELVFPNYSSPNGDVVVTGSRQSGVIPGINPAVIPPPAKQASFFSNFMRTMDQSRAAFGTFTSWVKGGMPAGGAGDAISGAMGAAGTAFAMYQTGNMIGKSVAKALGGGFRTQAVAGGITGGAAAGYSLGGPVGAAIGAVVGGVLGFLKKKPQIPSSFGAVKVGDNGVAIVGTTGTHGNADAKVGQAAAQAGASLFNDFAATYGGYLSAGNYGTFGKREYDPAGPGNKGMYSFWSSRGVNGNGKPAGTMGVDYIYGTDSEVQAFALLKQIREGMIKGLSDTILTVAKNTKATTMEALQSDLGIGQAYDQFIKGSFTLTDVASKISDLNEAFNKLKAQATVLGLSEDKLVKARQRMMNTMKEEFNFNIQQGILGYTNPALAAFNQLQKEYHDAVESAMAVGGDLVAVEDLYGRKRADLAKQWADIATNGLASAAQDLYNSLTASSNSPLNTQTVFSNARDLYTGLTSQFLSGDFSHVDQLSTFAQNYLDAARQMYGSSTDYFDIFKQVTDQLAMYENGTGLPGTTGGPPELPGLDDMVQEINDQSLEMIDAMGLVGQAVVEGSTNVVDAINNLAIALGQKIPATTTTTTSTPTGPTAGGTGVSSTGGTYGSTGVMDSGGVDFSGYTTVNGRTFKVSGTY
jgi:tape measure domain-containing protein